MNEYDIPSLPGYPPANSIQVATIDHQKPLMKIMGRMMSARLKMPHSKVISQTVKLKHKKVKFY